MDKKITGIVAYLTWIGWIVAFLAGDREGAKFHLNQALVLNLASLICGFIPLLGWIIDIVIFVFIIIAIIGAVQDQEKEVPLLGGIKLLK